MPTLSDIRYFYIDTGAAGLTWDGDMLVVPAGAHAIAGEAIGALSDTNFNPVSGSHTIISGQTSLTSPDGSPMVIVGSGVSMQHVFEDDGEALPQTGTLYMLLLSDGNLALVQRDPANPALDQLAQVLPTSVVFTTDRVVSASTSSTISAGYVTGSFGGAAGLVCFAAGTQIATLRGPVPVEAIRPGDRVLTRDRGFRPVHWVGRQALPAARLAAADRLRPVRIAAGALGPGVPARDLLVSPQHRMLLSGPEIAARFGSAEVLVAAKHLVGRPGIGVEVPAGGIAYHHLLFDAHEIVLADGAWAESLFTGPMAMKLMPAAQRAEIVTLFPALAQGGPPHAAPARRFLTGAEARALLRARPAFA